MTSPGFDRLHPRVQRWIWQRRWTQLRDIQEKAIAPILSQSTDVILSAATASGKTEAAFLPIFSTLLQHPSTSISVLYISPLKALINDQYRRLSAIGEPLEIEVHPWHGEIAAHRKQKLLEQPSGILLITPESLEALHVHRGSWLKTAFQTLNYIVVDELHSLIGTERGKQLQSLMQRIEHAVGKTIPRIGLSATLGDMQLASEFLRSPQHPQPIELIAASEAGQELKIQLRAYRKPAFQIATDETEDPTVGTNAEAEIAAHLFKVMRGTHNLVFANRRADVEAYADRLRQLSQKRGVPNEFYPHHGNLSSALRQDAENALQSDRPATVICTTTLEMGIDVGSMHAIAQIGAPFSVSSLRQRLGRSGRRKGEPAILRSYIAEPEIVLDSSLQSCLHPELVQSIAIVQLLLDRWCEPPSLGKLHLSTLIQQLLSLIAQSSGIRADQAWKRLCQNGAFPTVTRSMFVQLLRSIGSHDLITQSQDGDLLLGLAGEHLVNQHTFYSAFQTTEEYQLIAYEQTLGTLPINYPLVEGLSLVFAGRRWRIVSINVDRKAVQVEAATGGQSSDWSGPAGWIHHQIRSQMYEIYCSDYVPTFLDTCAKELLASARESFQQFQLSDRNLISSGHQTLIFSWTSDVVMNTILIALRSRGLCVTRDTIALIIDYATPKQVIHQLETILMQPPTAIELAATVKNIAIEKYDIFLTPELQNINYASGYLDLPAAQTVIQEMLATLS